MISSPKFRLISVMSLALIFLLVGVVSAQDLNKQKQEKLQRINAIDAKLKSVSKEEYDELLEERKKLVAEVKELDQKLRADADAMKTINSAKKAFNDGNNAYKLGQYQQAIDSHNKAISLDSTFYRSYYGKGLALKRIRKYQEAAEAYQGAIRHNPTYVPAYLALGKIYSALNQPDKAIQTYQKGIENDPSSDKLYYVLGEVYLDKKKDYNKAYQNFQKATQLDSEYDLAFYSLGVTLTELNRFDEAVMALENALAVTNRRNWESPHYRLAVVYNKQGDHGEAKAAAIAAMEAERNYAPAAYEAGKAAKELKQYDEAITYFERAARDKVWRRAAEYEIDLIKNRDKYGLD